MVVSNIFEVDLLVVLLFEVKRYILLLSILPLLLSDSEIYPSPAQATTSESSCVTYDSSEEIISITCKGANLSGVYHQLKDLDLLREEVDGDGVWQLNSGIVIEKDATLFINSTDTSWLKIISPSASKNGETSSENLVAKANGIEVLGSLKIDSVKISSWDPSSNNYAINEGKRNLKGTEYEVKLGSLRPFISVEGEATGTTDITNSEIAYLGYEGGVGGGPVVGLTYFGGDGSIISNNDIHHLYFAFYSNGVGHITIENNHIHDSGHYGLDPHTGTHDMIIRNNTVEDNGSIGIICSLDCYNIMIENNTVSNNTKMGIMFSRNMYDSIARNNLVSDEEQGIVVSESHNNEVYNNTVMNSEQGINVDSQSNDNRIYNNIIRGIPSRTDALFLEEGSAEQNTLYSNILINSDGNSINLD